MLLEIVFIITSSAKVLILMKVNMGRARFCKALQASGLQPKAGGGGKGTEGAGCERALRERKVPGRSKVVCQELPPPL